jgi:hypothetical protein
MRRSRLSQPAGCPQVHRRGPALDPTACGPCGQPAATDSNLTNNTVTLPDRERGRKRPGFLPFGYARGFGWWKRGYPGARWNDTRTRNAERVARGKVARRIRTLTFDPLPDRERGRSGGQLGEDFLRRGGMGFAGCSSHDARRRAAASGAAHIPGTPKN